MKPRAVLFASSLVFAADWSAVQRIPAEVADTRSRIQLCGNHYLASYCAACTSRFRAPLKIPSIA